jgi:hypothetical protein
MNITTMQMYWLVKLDNIRSLLEGMFVPSSLITFIGLFCVIALTLIYSFAGNGNYEMFCGKTNEEFQHIRTILWKWRGTCIKTSIIFFVIAIAINFMSALIPSTKQMAAIMIVPRLANSEKVQTIGNKVYDLAVEWMEELKPTKRK